MGSGVQLDAQVWGSRCGPQPLAPPPPPEFERAHLTNGQSERERGTLNGFPGAKADGVHVTLVRPTLDAHQVPTRVARLSIDHGRLWADAAVEEEAWCAGWVRVGRAATPFSLKLMPGTLTLHPPELHFVTAGREDALAPREVVAHNEFAVPLYVADVLLPPGVEELFDAEWVTPLTVQAGARVSIGRLTLRQPDEDLTLLANLTVVTNLTEYTLPLMIYSGKLAFVSFC